MALVKRLLRCNDCGFQFHVFQDKSEAPPADCPECIVGLPETDADRERAEGEERIARMLESGIPPATQSHRSQALKTAEAMMSEMGMTNMNDGGRQGDIAAKAPAPMQTREIQEITHAMAESNQMTHQEAQQFAEGARNFWQQPAQKTPAQLQKHISVAPAAAAEARSMGVDPIALLHDAKTRGHIHRNPQIVASVKG